MSLIGNYSVISKSPGRFRSGTSVSADRANFNKSSSARNLYIGEAGIPKYAAVPNGYLPPASWVIPQKAGGMASYTALTAIGDITNSNIAGGINLGASALTGYINISATGETLASLSSTIAGSGDLTSASINALVIANASITATGLITDAALLLIVLTSASATALLSITNGNLTNASLLGIANLTGSGSITDADLTDASLLASMSITASISITNGDLRANGFMDADILPYTDLSPESLANAVWGKSTLDELDAGTYGKLVKQLKGMIAAGL